MDRRIFLCAATCCAIARVAAQEEEARPRIRISAAQLYDAMAKRFPQRFGLPGVVEIEVSAPRLLLLPARNKLGASLVAQASGAFRSVRPGDLDLVFAVRYEAADRTLRGWRPEILDFHFPDLAPDATQALRALLPALARDVAAEVVLHRFTPGELALPDTMGLAPRDVTVLDDGLLVTFGQKARP